MDHAIFCSKSEIDFDLIFLAGLASSSGTESDLYEIAAEPPRRAVPSAVPAFAIIAKWMHFLQFESESRHRSL